MQRTVVVTGAASGIGKAVAKAFLALGDVVVATDANKELLGETARALAEQYGDGKVRAVPSDISREESVKELAAKTGGCDVLVNCAGVFRGGKLHEAAKEDFDIQFDVNVRGIFYMMRALLPGMIEKGKGAVVNIASISGMRGDYNAPLYCASKAAVINLTRSAALDYAGEGIRINCISPSATKTPMFLNGTGDNVMSAFLAALPDHVLGEPSQIAEAAVFLASDAAGHITGQNLPVDGGLSAWNGQPKQEKGEI